MQPTFAAEQPDVMAARAGALASAQPRGALDGRLDTCRTDSRPRVWTLDDSIGFIELSDSPGDVVCVFMWCCISLPCFPILGFCRFLICSNCLVQKCVPDCSCFAFRWRFYFSRVVLWPPAGIS